VQEYLSIQLHLLYINLCGDAASENRLPPKRFFAPGTENNHQTRYNKHKGNLYQRSGALSDFITILCFIGEEIPKQVAE
jgi:hypothetical protein